MSIIVKKFDKAQEAITFLEKLSLEKESYIYRGHSKESYRLQTTLSRHRSIPFESWSSDIDDMLDMFRAGLAKLNILPFKGDNRQDWLEYARHHGVPTPVLDFSYSPFVATFFAFNGTKLDLSSSPSEYVVIYALDIASLACLWSTLFSDVIKEVEYISNRRQEFLYPKSILFMDGFIGNHLQFIPAPSKYNYRMHKQQGALLYDTMDYLHLKVRDLDDLIEKYKEPDLPNADGSTIKAEPTLYKILINKNCISEIFTLLELMGITGGALYLNADGVALDVVNAYYYNSRTSYLRDLRFPLTEK